MSTEGLPGSDWLVGMSVGTALIDNELGGPSPSWVTSFPVRVVLGCLYEQTS